VERLYESGLETHTAEKWHGEKGRYLGEKMTAIGLQWVQSTDAYTRLEATAGMTAAQATALCNTMGPYQYMRRCNVLDNGTISAFYGDRCYDDSAAGVATNGQAMVNVKKFWYATDFATAGTYRWYISDTGTETIHQGSPTAWKVYPAFIRNGVTYNDLFVAAYKGSIRVINGQGWYESKAGVLPTTSTECHTLCGTYETISGNNTLAGTHGTNWIPYDFLSHSMLQMLFLLEYGTFNSQSVFPGVTNLATNIRVNTGLTPLLGNSSGQATYVVPSTGETTYPFSYRGIEGLWGDYVTLLAGINIKADHMPWVADHGFAQDTFDGTIYVDTGVTLPSADGYISDIAHTASFDYGFLASAATGSSTTKLCDWHWQQLGNCFPRVSGASNMGSYYGLFEFDTTLTTSNGGAGNTRLVFYK
jgi:hypothetical protein